jgi:hypothetical protein
MARTEFQKRMQEAYDPHAFKTRKPMWLTLDQIIERDSNPDPQKVQSEKQEKAALHNQVATLLRSLSSE